MLEDELCVFWKESKLVFSEQQAYYFALRPSGIQSPSIHPFLTPYPGPDRGGSRLSKVVQMLPGIKSCFVFMFLDFGITSDMTTICFVT